VKLNETNYAAAMWPAFVAPTLVAAGDKSAFFRVDGHAQVTSPITGAAAGTVMGHRSWSPPIT
jgi:hypothetical protein